MRGKMAVSWKAVAFLLGMFWSVTARANMYDDANGNIGIGTTAPAHKLEVLSSSGVGIGTTTAADALVVASNGNVGIGTSPQALLHVKSSLLNSSSNPAQISNLQLWLKADAITGKNDGDAISTWTDSSGNNNNATQATVSLQPVYKTNILNGQPVVRFDAADDGMSTTLGVSSGSLTVFVVYDTNSASSSRRAVQGSNNWLIGPWGGAHQYFNGAFINGGSQGLGTFVIAAAVQTSSSGTLYINGVNKGSNGSTTLPGTFYLGVGTYLEPLGGDIAEVIVYNKELNATEISGVNTYLTNKYNLVESNSFVVTSNGNVGIGTTVPVYTLEVMGTGRVSGAFSKGSGSFDIPHPDPEKEKQGWHLRHSFVEAPTRGDNLYRWVVNVVNKTALIPLPDYFKYLNENVQVWVSSQGHWGCAYGAADPELTLITITADTDGPYNVLAVGTRKDKVAKEGFDPLGIEYQKK